VALCQRDVPERRGADPYDYFTEVDYQQAVDRLLSERPRGPFWIFAYGSLLWKPEVEVARWENCSVAGWHRQFALSIDNYRATPEQKGYMMCLCPGAQCSGRLMALREDTIRADLHKLLYREVGGHEHLAGVRWLAAETLNGRERALAFFAGPDQLDFYVPGTPLPQVAKALARACGHWGSGAEYIYNTVLHLEELGFHDEELWRLQELVAAEIEAIYGVSG
jgi:glutathione-specific gamma-glutamylcyclotransferase